MNLCRRMVLGPSGATFRIRCCSAELRPDGSCPADGDHITVADQGRRVVEFFDPVVASPRRSEGR